MFGYPCELDELRAIAERHGLWLIDDSCEALGAEYKGAPIGSHGPSGAFGFYPNKQLTTGEGGMVTTHSEEEWELLKSLRNQGRSYDSRWFHHPRVGFNYRLTDMQAALGISQLEKLDRMLELRERGSCALHRAARRRGRRRAAAPGRRGSQALVVRLRGQARARDRPRRCASTSLGAQGIEAGHYVPAVHLQPYMREQYGFSEGVCPVAEDACDRSLALPFFPQLEAADQELRRRRAAGCDLRVGDNPAMADAGRMIFLGFARGAACGAD